MSNDLLRAAERRLTIALETFDRLEAEITSCTRQHAEAEARERELRQKRAPLDELSAMTARRIAAASLLDQAKTDLEPAREELHAAEIAANRERQIAAAIPIDLTCEHLEAELRDEFAELERVLSPALARLFGVQDRVEQQQSAWANAFKAIDPPLAPGELTERGGQNPPAILSEAIVLDGDAVGHPLARDLSKLSPRAYRLLYAEIARRAGERFREAQAKHKARERARRAALRPDGSDPQQTGGAA